MKYSVNRKKKRKKWENQLAKLYLSIDVCCLLDNILVMYGHPIRSNSVYLIRMKITKVFFV
jgi:hypothetical protein